MNHKAAIALAGALLFSAGGARAQDTAHTVLSPADVRAYTDIFAAQESGKLAKADTLIKSLSDRSLMGYVLQQRYLLPHGYRTKFAELKDWMGDYGDLIGADRIYKLAQKRAPKKTKVPAPQSVRWRGAAPEPDAITDTPPESAEAQRIVAQMRMLVRDNRSKDAELLLDDAMARPDLPQADVDRLAAYVAAAYRSEAKDDEAMALAEEVIARGARNAPLCHWIAGLSAYRKGMFESAATHFEAMAQAIEGKNYSGGDFWAARSWMRAGHPERVVALYTRAAATPNSFYGMLAAHVLGRDIAMNFADPSLDTVSFAVLMESKAAHRAVALWQIGRSEAVEPEMARAFGEISPELDPQYAALARYLGVPSLELRAAETSTKRNIYLTSLYPVPPYQPKGGYALDKAVLLGFARQESRFQSLARSGAGARGIMQIMPQTAALIAKDSSLAGANKERLDDPVFSMTLGQNYLMDLLERQNGNLFALAAAYNAGIGNISRWTALNGDTNDPLLFIESIPVPETRDFVKRVMTNVWMYRRRLGESTDGLGEAAAGDWPIYQKTGRVAAQP